MKINQLTRIFFATLDAPMRVAILAAGCWLAIILTVSPTIAQEDAGYSSSIDSLFDAPELKSSYEFSNVPPLNEPSTNRPSNHATLRPIAVQPKSETGSAVAHVIETSDTKDEQNESRTVGYESGTPGVTANAVWNSTASALTPIKNAPSNVVQPVYHEPYAPLPKPAAAPAPTRQPVAPPANEHRLQNMTWQSFEQRLVDTWGKSLKVNTSADGQMARVMLPHTDGTDYLPVLINRTNNSLTFEGTPRQHPLWNQLIGAVDRIAAEAGVCQLIPMESAQTSTIHQAAFTMGFKQDQQPGNTVRDQVQVPGAPDRRGQPPVVLTQENVQGNVKIQVLPELGIIILEGDDKDVAIVRGMINEIIAKSVESQPISKNIPLKNQQSNTMAEQVQTIWDENFAESRSPATIISLDQSNSLFVIGQADSVAQIELIILAMDTAKEGPVEPDFKVFKLKYMSALDAKNRIEDFFGNSDNNPRSDTEPPPLPSVVVLDYRSNILIVKASANLLAQTELLLKEIDVDETETTDIIRIVPLRNALATQLAPLIQNAINGNLVNAGQGFNSDPQQQAGQGNQQAQNTAQDLASSNQRSAMLEIVGENGEIIRSGILFDVRISADQNSNSLVITGPEKSMGLIVELINRLDRLPDAETLIKIFPIVNGDAQLILDALEALFTGTTQGQQGQGQQGTQGQQGNLLLPLQSATSADGQSLASLRFSADPRTNTIIASGPASELIVVEDLIDRLDAEGVDGRRTQIYELANLSAQDMAAAISTWLQDRQTILGSDPSVAGELALARSQVTVTPVDVPNSLIINAFPEFHAEIDEVIRNLDRKQKMVKLKAMIAEVNLSSLEEFGIDVGVQDSLLFDRGTADNINFNFNQSAIGNTNIGRNTLAGQALSNLGTGRTNSALGYGGLVISAGNDSVSVLLRALKDRNCLRVLSKPHMMTMENLQGRVQVGQSVPRITSSNQNQFGGIQNSVEEVDVGVILEVTPRVSPDGTIVMFVNATRSRLGSEDDGVAVAVSPNGEVVRQAPIDQTVAQTTIQARSGQTVVISGLVEERKDHTKRGTPILSDLPVIGPLFSFQRDIVSRTELLIILTPYVVDGDQDIKMQNQDEMDRMHWCMSDVSEIYGNTEYDNTGTTLSAPEVYYPDMDPSGLEPQALPQEPANTYYDGQEQIMDGNLDH